ncbi:MAG: YfhO family protein [Lachnospiraceae bacterium]|nr:YfhO family protein [Lachnospiraceae bacterium]
MRKMIRRWTDRAEDGSKSFLRSYTIAFFAVCLIVFPWYYCAGRALLWKGDGWAQHYKAILYYAKYLRGIVRNAFTENTFVIPTFDVAIGEGNDILETFHYYVIGDPFAFFSFLIPSRLMIVYYVAMILLRMYLAGLAFTWMCRTLCRPAKDAAEAVRKPGNVALIAGAMAYVFAYWGLFNAARHPYFLNPCIYLPLLVVGIEKILRKERPYLFAGTVAVAGLSNFYFFYLLAILAAMYAVARILWLRRKAGGEILRPLVRLGAAATVGVLLSAVIFLPMCRAFLTNARMGTENVGRWLYPLSYYAKLPVLTLSSGNDHWFCLGIAAPVFPAICLMWRRKGNGFCKLCMAICGVMAVFPVFGRMMNGFSYITNRWSFALALVCATALVIVWDDLMSVTKQEWKFLCICCGVYAAFCIIAWNSRTLRAFGSVALLALTIWVLRPAEDGENRRSPAAAAVGLIALALGVNSFWLNAYISDSYAAKSAFVWDAVTVDTENEASEIQAAVQSLGDTKWFRYSGTGLELNANVVGGVSSTQFYWTIASPALAEYRSAIAIREYSIYKYSNYDERAILTSLAAVRYYLENPAVSAKAPFGFTEVGTMSDGKTKLFRNEYSLPVMYTYDSFLPRSAWDERSAAEKEDILLHAMVLEETPDGIEAGTADAYRLSKECPYEISCDGYVTFYGGTFTVEKQGAVAWITFEGLPKSETMVEVSGAKIAPTTGQEPKPMGQKPYKKPITVGPFTFEKPADFRFLATDRIDWKVPDTAEMVLLAETGTEKSLVLYNNEYRYYNGREDFCVNLGYSEAAQNKIRITFTEAGTYSFDALRVWCRPMEGYVKEIEKRREDTATDIVLGGTTISATVTTSEPKLLCIAIPYHDGFTAYVNGKKTTLYHANVGYMGVELETGVNRVFLEYREPLRLAGELITLIAMIGSAVYVVLYERRRREDKT